MWIVEFAESELESSIGLRGRIRLMGLSNCHIELKQFDDILIHKWNG